MDTRELEIVLGAEKLFRQHGYKRVTMDAIASALGMSKKTLYKHFDNKRDLILRIMRYNIENRKQQLCELEDNARDAIGEMTDMIAHVIRMFDQVGPDIFYELKHYYPKSWAVMDDFMQQHVYERLLKNIRGGREQGLYRTDFDEDILARMYVTMVRSIVVEESFPGDKYDKKVLLKTLIEYHIRGIASEEGRRLFESYALDAR